MIRAGVIFLLFCTCIAPTFAQDLAQRADRVGDAPLRKDYETADFKIVVKEVKSLVAKHSGREVLFVVDIDNTMLAMNQDLGSDQWFNWQDGLLSDQPNSPDLVADDFDGLLRVQGILFSPSAMHPPEPQLPSMIEEIQGLGVTTVVLTSRGPGYRDAAERELKRNQYDFAKTALAIQETRGLFMPFDPERPNAHGLSAEIIEGIKSRLSPVSYSNGIYMTAGQHKGYMLRTLLARTSVDRRAEGSRDLGLGEQFKAIVFVDDRPKHTKRVHEAFEGAAVDLATFRYSREDGNVAKFDQSSKRHVVDDWSRLDDFITDVLVK